MDEQKDDLQYLEDQHEYWLSGKKMQSVTGILRDVGIADVWKGAGDYKMYLGSVVHEAIHYLNKGTLDWDSVDQRALGYVRAYESFLSRGSFVVKNSEKPRCEPIMQFGGRPDVDGLYNGKPAIIDYKTGLLPKWVKIQLAGYCVLMQNKNISPYDIKRIGLELHEDGSYKVEVYRDVHDIDIFYAAYSVANWVRNH